MPTGCDGGAIATTSPIPGPDGATTAEASQPLSSQHIESSDSYVTEGVDTESGSDDGAEGSGRSSGAGPGPGSSATPGSGSKGPRRGGGRSKSAARGTGNNKPPVQGLPPVLLMLAGLPGSGKSTFSRSLQESSAVSWVHVNQDAINNGKPGKREQCVAAVRAALAEGSCCIIDRCHLDASQRETFLQLAAECAVAPHCVALAMPAKECAARVAARTDHPGGVQGDRNKGVVFRMARQQQDGKGWPPAAAEGFVSVMECLTDSDANIAVRAWAVYGAAAAAAGTTANANAAAAQAVAPPAGSTGIAAAAHPSAAPQSAAEAQAAPTLAMWKAHVAKRKPPVAPPSITAFFKPAAAKPAAGAGSAATARTAPGAAGVAAPAAGKARASGAAAGAPIKAAAASGLQVGAAKSASAPGAQAAATVAGAAAARPRSAGSSPAEQRPAKRAATAQQPLAGSAPGGAAAGTPTASLGQGSPPSAGQAAKQEASAGSNQPQGSAKTPAAGSGAGANAFAVLMKGSRQAAAAAAGAKPGAAGAVRANQGGASADGDRRFRLDSPWAQALRKTALDPDGSQQQVLHKDEQVVMIMDAFPKARSHALVIARDPALRSIADLRAAHVPLLEHMRQVAQDWVAKRREQVPGTAAFKLGFHAVPSMCQLHLHIISQDFDSPALKNKKHWNTFTTEFFLPLEAVLAELSSQGQVSLISEAEEKRLEGLELRCHACGKPEKTIPALKGHIVACNAVKRLPGL